MPTLTGPTSVRIAPGCIACRLCESECPQVFRVDARTGSAVRPEACAGASAGASAGGGLLRPDLAQRCASGLARAAEGCPVGVIGLE